MKSFINIYLGFFILILYSFYYNRNDQQILVHLKALHPLKDFSVANKISTSANITIGCLKSFISKKKKLKDINVSLELLIDYV